jgi:hypothetical protein
MINIKFAVEIEMLKIFRSWRIQMWISKTKFRLSFRSNSDGGKIGGVFHFTVLEH